MSVSVIRNLPQEEQDKIIKMYIEDGMTQKEIGKLYGVDQTVMSGFFRSKGISNVRNVKFSERDKSDIYDLYVNKNMYQKDIAEIYNTKQSTISVLLNKMGVSHGLTKDKIQRIINLYEHGTTINELTQIFRTSYKKVTEILTDNGIEIRTKSDAQKKYCVNSNYFDEIDTPNKAYFLGFLYTDGCVHMSNNKYSISLTLQEEDVHILESFRKELETDKPLYYSKLNDKNNNWKNTYSLQINDKHMCKMLSEKWGCFQNKSLDLKFPQNLDHNLYSHFIRGCIDGDGTISRNPTKRSVGFIGTLDMCENISKILNENCGANFSMYKQANVYIIYAGLKRGAINVLDYIYKDAELYLYRKHDIYTELYKQS